MEYNERNGITPQSIVKPIDMSLVAVAEGDYVTVPLEDDEEVEDLTPEQRERFIGELEEQHARSRPQVRVRKSRAAARPREGAQSGGLSRYLALTPARVFVYSNCNGQHLP